MSRFGIAIYGLFAYLVFFATFLYLIGFVEGAVVPKAMNDGEAGNYALSLLINLGLLALFGIQHSIMARPWFKKRWVTIVPLAAERSTFVLISSALLILTMWGWQPVTHVMWDHSGTTLGIILSAVSLLGWLLVLAATFNIDHFHLFGLKQVAYHLVNRRMGTPTFIVRGLYHLVRHPLMLGFLVAFWATPKMTLGHFEFALVMTGYIMIALHYEERDLVDEFGSDYIEYQETTPRLNPIRIPSSNPAPEPTNTLR